jgi:glycosyltransferase involved in cell wall biosynthesis
MLKMKRPAVYFVGPLPLPLHGFSAINQKMLSRLLSRTDVRIFDTAPKRLSANSRWRAFLKPFHSVSSVCTFVFFAFAKRPRSVYLGLSGGIGQVFDCLRLIIASLVGAKTYVHHHSFAYLNNPKLYSRLCLWSARDACHIVLCDVMAAKLVSTYGINSAHIFTLSNAAFLDEASNFPANRGARSDVLTLGFISNITPEKGIAEFFDVVAALTEDGLRVKGLVAGPVDPALRRKFSEMLKHRADIEYIGAVYGEQKRDFFHRIDLLLFPTKYRNEAEPVTVLEALSYGVPVIAAGRGCLHSMIDKTSGAVFTEIEQYVAGATSYIRSLMSAAPSLNTLSRSAFNQFTALRVCNARRLDDLIERIAGDKRTNGEIG